MSILRESAKGRNCEIRLPGICNHNPETTVLCHLRQDVGGSLKANDMEGAFGCSDCHDEVDRRTTKMDIDYVMLAFHQAVIRTQRIWRKEGYLIVVNPPKRCVSDYS